MFGGDLLHVVVVLSMMGVTVPWALHRNQTSGSSGMSPVFSGIKTTTSRRITDNIGTAMIKNDILNDQTGIPSIGSPNVKLFVSKPNSRSSRRKPRHRNIPTTIHSKLSSEMTKLSSRGISKHDSIHGNTKTYISFSGQPPSHRRRPPGQPTVSRRRPSSRDHGQSNNSSNSLHYGSFLGDEPQRRGVIIGGPLRVEGAYISTAKIISRVYKPGISKPIVTVLVDDRFADGHQG